MEYLRYIVKGLNQTINIIPMPNESGFQSLVGANSKVGNIVDKHKSIGTSFISGYVFYPMIGTMTVMFAFMSFSVFSNRRKPHIQTRSPILILVIMFGAYVDNVLNLAIQFIDDTNFDV